MSNHITDKILRAVELERPDQIDWVGECLAGRNKWQSLSWATLNLDAETLSIVLQEIGIPDADLPALQRILDAV